MSSERKEGQEVAKTPNTPEQSFSGRKLVEFINGNTGLVKRVLVKPEYSYLVIEKPIYQPTYKSGKYAIQHRINYELFGSDVDCFRVETERYLQVPTLGNINPRDTSRAILTAYQRSKELRRHVPDSVQVQHDLSLDYYFMYFSGATEKRRNIFTEEEMEEQIIRGLEPFATEPLI